MKTVIKMKQTKTPDVNQTLKIIKTQNQMKGLSTEIQTPKNTVNTETQTKTEDQEPTPELSAPISKPHIYKGTLGN